MQFAAPKKAAVVEGVNKKVLIRLGEGDVASVGHHSLPKRQGQSALAELNA